MTIPLTKSVKPSRFPNGINNQKASSTLGKYPFPAWTPGAYEYSNDFDTYAAADWTVTETSAAGTQVLGDADGGVLVLTNPANNSFLNSLQLSKLSVYFSSGKDMWFRERFKISDATNTVIFAGLMERNVTPFGTVNNQIGFYKAGGSATIQFRVSKAGADTHVTSGLGSFASDTYVVLGFHYDAHANELELYVNDAKVYTYTAVSAKLPTVGLCPTMSIQNNNTAGRSMTIDNILAAKMR